MKIESKKWKHYSEKCNHCCEINLIFNRKLSYKHFQTKRSRNWEGKRFYQLEISLTQLTFFCGTRENLYPKKKRDPILLLSRFFLLLIVDETMNIRGEDGKIPGFESSAVIDYLPCTRRIGFEKFFFQRDERNIGAKKRRRLSMRLGTTTDQRERVRKWEK